MPETNSGTNAGGGGASRGQTASPQNTSPTGLPPKAITTAYGFPTTGGAGKTIAIVDAYDDPTIASNLNTFSNQYGLPPCTTTNGCFTKVNQTGGTTFPRATSGWGLEISLDVEWAHALAPSAHILLVEATSNSDTNLFVAVTYASQHAQYVSMSWGGTEYTGEATFDADFTAAPSVSFFAASGDSGRRVVYPSASPDVISVGGTTLTVTKTTYAWKGESAWVKGGGGCSVFEPASAAQQAFPSYDQPGATCGGYRSTPDVALDGNPSTGVSVYDTEQLSTGLQRWLKVGGTSASAVLWAARSAVAGAHVTATYVYGDNIPYYEVVTAGQQCGSGYNFCSGVGSWNQSHGSLGATLSFSASPQTLTTGQVSVADAVDLSAPAPATGGLSVSLSTSSSGGGFSTSPAGPFAPTLSVSVPAGATASGTFYYRDTKAGRPVVTASAPNVSPVTQTDTINVGPLARITVSPTTLNLTEGANQSLTATAVDQYTNPIPGFDPTWTATAGRGTFSQAQGANTTFTASSAVGTGAVTATQSGVHATVPVTVTELSQPAAIVNSSTWMDVFYDNPSGNLMNAWWQSTNGWHNQVLATGMVGSPAAIVNSSTWMDVFYDSSSGDLMNEWWQSTSGWHNQVLATGMVGSPTAVTRTATTMDVFYQSTSGQLMHASWTVEERVAGRRRVGHRHRWRPYGGRQQLHLDGRLLQEHLGPADERVVAVGERLAQPGVGHRHGGSPRGGRQQLHLDGRLLPEHLGSADERLVAVGQRMARPGAGDRRQRDTDRHRAHSDIDGRLLPEHFGPADERVVEFEERMARPVVGQWRRRAAGGNRQQSHLDGRLLPEQFAETGECLVAVE